LRSLVSHQLRLTSYYLANGSVFDLLAASPEGRILEQFDQLVDRYLSEVGTDIAVPT